MFKKMLLVFILAGVTAFSKERPADDNLTREFAKMRKAQVEEVAYDLHFTFTQDPNEFKGHALIDVKLSKTDKPLSFDFMGKSIESVIVNGKAIAKYTQRKGSLDIPAKSLDKVNKIEIAYTGVFEKEDNGIQRIVDPEDKSVYIYTDFEPYYAHKLFPCFDQPDLKATFQVHVTAPAAWTVIGNELIKESKKTADVADTYFQKTPRISTYLFFVGAGDFVEWKDKAGDIPLFIYARKSLAKYMDAPRLFEVTKKGLAFYGDYFGVKYPFSKYGQVFVPEFAWGGMENPGAVALNEGNIFRGPVTESRYEGRDDLILHEMAHMWFGDLVTMNWWDDLWLNESFASYLATVASTRAMKAKGALLGSISGKGWGYWQDQLVTTHPIETLVPDTRTAKGNFDGITYSKGEASLKQLHFFVGEDGFRKGLQNYFKKYAFQNTSRADFIGEISKASGEDLEPWTKAWLQTAGPHRVQAQWKCENGKINVFQIEQKLNASGALSPHKTKIALYKASGDSLKSYHSEDVRYTNTITQVTSLMGQDCPDFVFPNQEDHDYALFSLDEKSKVAAKNVLMGSVQDPAVRLMTWQMLAQMVRDQKLPVNEYFDFVLAGIEKEKDEPLLSIILGRRSTIRNYFYGYLTLAERDKWAPKIEAIAQARLAQEKSGGNLQMTFFDFSVGIAHTQTAQDKLNGYLKGEGLPKGFVLDQDRRWAVIKQLSSYGYANVAEMIDQEEKRDPSKTGLREAYVARTAMPVTESKNKFWTTLSKPEGVPFGNLRSASGAFNNPNKVDLTKPFVKPFFDKVTSIDWKNHDSMIEVYFEGLFPHTICSKGLLKESEGQMKRAKNLTPLAKRAWLEANDELSKCVAIRSHDI